MCQLIRINIYKSESQLQYSSACRCPSFRLFTYKTLSSSQTRRPNSKTNDFNIRTTFVQQHLQPASVKNPVIVFQSYDTADSSTSGPLSAAQNSQSHAVITRKPDNTYRRLSPHDTHDINTISHSVCGQYSSPPLVRKCNPKKKRGAP